jgi:hypothetical protein
MACVAALAAGCNAATVTKVAAAPHKASTPKAAAAPKPAAKPATAPVTTPALPFNLPATATLRASSHKVFAHYFTPYPLSIDNKSSSSDYYATAYLNPNGENGKHAAYGGFLRDRPLAQPVSTRASWQLDNYKKEIKTAASAGLDGFTVDVLSVTPGDYNWERLKLLVQAADESDPGFKMVMMPDATQADADDPNQLAAAMAELAKHPSAYHLPDGRLVVSPFDPERQGAAWWQSWIKLMHDKYGVTVAFVPCFLDYRPNVAAFAPFSYGLSDWGYRNPTANANLAANMADAHSRGKIWMQAVSAQDERPYASTYDEADNTENFRQTWTAAINGADWVQIPTWNDYSEGTEISPSTHIGYSLLDLASYYLTRFKTGQWPTIVRDVVYLSHRTQSTTTPSSESSPMTLRAGGTAPRDTVEALSFLTTSADVTATVGGAQQTYSAPAGLSSRLFPLRAGTNAISVSRAGHAILTVASPFVVKTSAPIQDLSYYLVSSGRS